jgi:hypothetical protein
MRTYRSSIVRQFLLLACAFGAASVGALIIDRIQLAAREPAPITAVLMPNPRGDKPEMPPGFDQMGMWDDPNKWLTHRFGTGTLAPDFTMRSIDGDRRVQLSELREKTPVVLLFGSFGCDLFCRDLLRLTRLHHVYHDRAAFYFVYSPEGPHRDTFPRLPGEATKERIRRGLKHFHLTMPCVFIDDAVQYVYETFPAHILVVGRDGRIELDLGKPMGPYWHLDQLEFWLRQAPITNRSDLTLSDPGV